MGKGDTLPAWMIFGILIPVTLIFAFAIWQGRTTEADRATDRVRAFLNTVKMERYQNALLVLSEDARAGLTVEEFRRRLGEVPAFAGYESFEPGEIDDPLRVAGTLTGAGASHALAVRFAEDGKHVEALRVDDRALIP